MKSTILLKGCLPSALFCLVQSLNAEPIKGQLDPLVLTGRGEWGAWGERAVLLETNRHRATDGASLLAGTPGVAVVRNGGQTGIVQMRGLSGDRVKVLLDGVSVSPACTVAVPVIIG